MKKIKTSKHSLSELNIGKKNKLKEFISDYQNAVNYYVNYLWNN